METDESKRNTQQIPALDPTSLDPNEDAVLPISGRRGREARGEIGLTPDGRLKTGRLAGLSLRRAIFTLSWPVLVDSFLNSLVGLTDTMVAAAISTAATDAIGNASYTLWFVGLFFMALDIGATALLSRAVGGGRMAVANAAVGQTLLLAAVLGVVLGVFMGLVADPLGSLMGMSGDAAAEFRTYLHVVAFDIPFMSVLVAGIACLRGSGDTFRPMRAMILVNIVNLALSWALSGADYRTTTMVDGQSVTRIVIQNPFPFHLGVMGIGFGTLLGHATGAALIVWTLFRGSAGLKLKRHRLYKPHWHTMRRIVRVGFPNFLETLGMWAGNFPIILMVGWISADLVGAHILAVRIEAFSFQPGFAIGIAAAALAGQYLGAGSPRLARRAILICTALSSIVMAAMGILFIFAGQQIVSVLSPQPLHLEVTPKLLAITGLVQIPFAIGIVFRQAMRGAGDVKVVMYITWLCTYGARLPLAYILSGVDIPLPGGGHFANPFGFHPSVTMLWVGLCAEIILRAIAFTARFIQGGWATARV